MALKRWGIILFILLLTAADMYRSQSRTYKIEDPVGHAFRRGLQNLSCPNLRDPSLLYICKLGQSIHQIRLHLNMYGYVPLQLSQQGLKSALSEGLGFVLGERGLDPRPFFKTGEIDLNFKLLAQGYGAGRLALGGYSATLYECRHLIPSEWTSFCIYGLGRASVDQIQTWFESHSVPREFSEGNAFQRREMDRLRP